MPESPEPSHQRLGALAHRDFFLLWAGQGVSLIGTQVQRVAVAWHMYLLTHSPWSLGLIGLFRLLPVLVFGLLGGATADAFDRRKLLLVTQTLLALSSVGLAVLTHLGHIDDWSIYLLVFVAASANAFDLPARQSLVTNLVPAEHLPGALSLNATSWQVASVLGPAIAGFLLDAGGVELAYALDALTFLAVIGAVLAMRHRGHGGPMRPISLTSVAEGLRYVAHHPVIRGMMLIDFLATFFGDATMLMPIFAEEVFHSGARGLGWLNAARSLGAVVAGLILTWRRPIEARGPVVIVSVIFYGLSIVAFGLSRWFWWSVFFLAVSGASDTVSMVVRQTVRQLLTPNELRGRVTSVNMIFFGGGPQLGEVESGALARWIGAPLAVAFGGAACAATGLLFALFVPSVHRHRASENRSRTLVT